MMTLRLQSALCMAVLAAVIVLASGMFLLMFFQHKHNRDMIHTGQYLAGLISSDNDIQEILPTAQNPEEAQILQPILKRYIDSHPNIQSCTLFGAFHIQLVVVENTANQPPTASDPITTETYTESEIQSSRFEDQLFPLEALNGNELGKIRLRWNSGNGGTFQHTLQQVVMILSGISFFLVLAASYLWLLKRYSNEHYRLSKHLSQLVTNNLSTRLDPRSYSKDIAELSTYINRILTELEEARKQRILAQDSYRQMERTQNDSIRFMEKQSKQIASLYEEMQLGLNRLFSLLPCGLMIIDQEFRIQWSNSVSERLLRFANLDDGTIQDDRIKRCLSPLVRLKTTEKISDICAWPQPSLGIAASCRIQAAAVPAQDASPLYFVTIEEDSGFPQQHTPEYFSHRLVIDVLSRINGINICEETGNQWNSEVEFDNESLWRCLGRIERYQEFEQDRTGKVTTIRLTNWLQTMTEKNDLYSELLTIIPQTAESDVQINVPEDRFSEMVSTIVEIVFQKIHPATVSAALMSVRTYWNARGKPVIEWMVPDAKHDDIMYLKEVFGGRHPLHCDQFHSEPLEIGKLEFDISLTVFHFLRQYFRAYVECMYSSGKQLGIVRLIVERYQFPEKNQSIGPVEIQEKPEIKSKTKPESEIKNILQNFLGKIEPERSVSLKIMK